MHGKPNAILHMMGWGFVSGAILALLYMLFIFGMNMSIGDLARALLEPFLWVYALLFGGIPGLAFGFIDGIVLWQMSKDFEMPFTKQTLRDSRVWVYSWMGGIAGILGLGVSLFFGTQLFSYTGLLFLIPVPIAAIAAAYAGHRYLFRLRLWSDGEFGARKQKSKHDFAHLEENLSDEGILDETLADSQSELLNS